LGFVPLGRLGGISLHATDVDRAWRRGAEVRGPASALMMAVSGRRRLLVPGPGGSAELTARVLEWKSNVLTRREPTATVEGVRIARRATALSVDKARRELGYVPRPIEPLLREMIALMSGASVSEVLKHA